MSQVSHLYEHIKSWFSGDSLLKDLENLLD